VTKPIVCATWIPRCVLAERAVAAGQQAGDRSGQALSLGRAGRIYSDREEPEKAMGLHQQALGFVAEHR
jgi:hypothetical protein